MGYTVQKTSAMLESFGSLALDDSKFPSRVLFIIPAMQVADPPITTSEMAEEMVMSHHYWCCQVWQMTFSRRRLFLERYKREEILKKAMYLEFSGEPKDNMNVVIYTWSWVSNTVYGLLLELMVL